MRQLRFAKDLLRSRWFALIIRGRARGLSFIP
jgi:hypothetical protein